MSESESAADPLPNRTRSRLYLPLCLGLLAAGIVAWGFMPSPVRWKSTSGWTSRSDFSGRHCFALSSRKDDGSSEIVVDYDGLGWNPYRWYRNGELWETGNMVIFLNATPGPGFRHPRISLRVLADRKRVSVE